MSVSPFPQQEVQAKKRIKTPNFVSYGNAEGMGYKSKGNSKLQYSQDRIFHICNSPICTSTQVLFAISKEDLQKTPKTLLIVLDAPSTVYSNKLFPA
jgi:hypothetical protein